MAAGNSATPPVPMHADDALPPAPDASASRHGANWVALLSEGSTAATDVPRADRPLTDVPPVPGNGADGTPGNGLITASDRSGHTRLTETSAPIADPALPGATSSADSTHDQPTPAPSMRTHRVASGETFSSIARATYGDSKYFKDIIKANPKIDPSHLRPGMLIALPAKRQAATHDASSTAPSTAPRHQAPAASAAVNSTTEYRVQSSDSLYKISMKLYHSPNKVDAIYQLNKGLIGSDPAKLKLNMVLKLPEPPAQTADR
jgi:nucleoid-associated protein YgaU